MPQREFAAILLDVDPSLTDGFETAMLIRERESAERTPILFVTSGGDDLHLARGHSLGAVDFVVTPFVPDVLRTKVSVFVDLYNAVRTQRRHAEALASYARRLRRLTRAAQAINAGGSTDAIADAAMLAARDILGGTSVAVGLTLGENQVRTRHLAPLDDDAPSGCAQAVQELLSAYALRLQRPGEVLRIAPNGGVAAAPNGEASDAFPRIECLLAPLVGRDGRPLGLVCSGDKADGASFDQDDETLFLQLAQMTGLAIENLLLSQEQEASKLKEEFLSTLSHELRTPLTAILGWVRLLQQGRLDDRTTARALEVIDRNVKKQSKLIDDLLDVSRIAAGKLRLSVQPVAMHELLSAAVAAARPMADAKGLLLTTVLSDEVDTVPGDPDRLQQVVWNLLTNAIKFTPQGGRIDVRLARRDTRVVLEVHDTGKGIPREFLPHVFERFRQADGGSTRMQGGLGVGLAVVRHIVERHGGAVHAESDGENRGATFRVILPSMSAHGASVESAAALATRRAPAPSALAGLRALVIDDDADTRYLLQEVLIRSQMDVVAVDSAAEARAALDVSAPDVIVCDIAMPGQDGWTFLSEVRQRPGRRVPAIAVSAYAGEAERARSIAVGFDAHLAKPIELDELTSVIAELTRRRSHGSAGSSADTAVRTSR
ncbi:MAG TPA: ATP-binding protein [Candidatus Binatia bacterium]